MASQPDVMDKLVSLCKRRGFIFQSSEIYGGTGSVWDYGPLGVELKKNIKDRWWNAMVRSRDDIEGLDAAILMHPRTWEASGHVAGFVDPLVDCKTCKGRFRADKLEDARCPQKPSKQPGQHDACQLTEARNFNLMFKTYMGALEESASIVYLRPETAQGIFVNFLNVQQSMRQKVPFGIAQIGKAFGGQLLNRNDQGCPFAHQHHRHTHAQIAPRAGQSFGKGKGKRHGITSYTILGAVPQFETIPSLATRPRESTVTYLAVGPCQVHLT